MSDENEHYERMKAFCFKEIADMQDHLSESFETFLEICNLEYALNELGAANTICTKNATAQCS